ncbi:hypothetical protein J6590_093959 [Homalodisca vitripennis]|nr:hypothetical protein J6590_024973 [Homalodisca vitripennis]KAG8334285.1 hypothetical protein J6590_093959 [Homalodisca vitripennis]
MLPKPDYNTGRSATPSNSRNVTLSVLSAVCSQSQTVIQAEVLPPTIVATSHYPSCQPRMLPKPDYNTGRSATPSNSRNVTLSVLSAVCSQSQTIIQAEVLPPPIVATSHYPSCQPYAPKARL